MKKKTKTNIHGSLTDLYEMVEQIDKDLVALKPYELDKYPEVRENRNALRDKRTDVVATIRALGGNI